MEDISEYLIQKGYKIEYKTINPKGRGKFQYDCAINKEPIDEDIREMEHNLGLIVLKSNFKKDKELTIIYKEKKNQ